jgi:hypothetical protein
VTAVEVILGVLFLGLAVRSFVRWMREGFVPESGSEQVTYALHATARVGVWVALGAFFLASALVDHPESLTWFGVVIIALAGIQLVTGFLLARPGNSPTMEPSETRRPPGPLEPEKRGSSWEPEYPEPQAAEVESARLLANQARPALLEAGLGAEQIRRLADDYIAEDRGEDLEAFILWAKARAGRGGGA